MRCIRVGPSRRTVLSLNCRQVPVARSIQLNQRQPTGSRAQADCKQTSSAQWQVSEQKIKRQHSVVLKAMAKGEETRTDRQGKKIGVLFVCLGNICRSPTAEAMFRAVVKSAGLEDQFNIDSCGTGGGNPDWYLKGGWSYHEGEDADPRMTQIAKQRGVILTSRSRPLQPLDLSRFDYIIGMEDKNMRAMTKAINYWRDLNDIPEDFMSRLSLMTQYCSKYKVNGVPDPYYAEGPEMEAAFDRVLDLLEDACVGLLERIKKDKQL